MKTIRLNREYHTLKVADSSEDIDHLNGTTVSYDVSYVVSGGKGWYDMFNEQGILIGFVTDVEKVEEWWW